MTPTPTPPHTPRPDRHTPSPSRPAAQQCPPTVAGGRLPGLATAPGSCQEVPSCAVRCSMQRRCRLSISCITATSGEWAYR
eukprot:scaffold6061_cov94-Isochrysis_galbana.AAC.5